MGMEMPMDRGRFLQPNRIMQTLVSGSHPLILRLLTPIQGWVLLFVSPVLLLLKLCTIVTSFLSSEIKEHQGKGISHLEKRLTSRKRISKKQCHCVIAQKTGGGGEVASGGCFFFNIPSLLVLEFPLQDCQHWEICLKVEKYKRKLGTQIVKSRE